MENAYKAINSAVTYKNHSRDHEQFWEDVSINDW